MYDGLVLDIMMPGMDGLSVLSRLRREGKNMPVLLLTAKGELEDRVAGLESGADDDLPKPFAMTELLARVRAMLRIKISALGAPVEIRSKRGVSYALEAEA